MESILIADKKANLIKLTLLLLLTLLVTGLFILYKSPSHPNSENPTKPADTLSSDSKSAPDNSPPETQLPATQSPETSEYAEELSAVKALKQSVTEEIEKFDQQEAELYKKDLEAEKIIAELEAQVKEKKKWKRPLH